VTVLIFPSGFIHHLFDFIRKNQRDEGDKQFSFFLQKANFLQKSKKRKEPSSNRGFLTF
jgi:hypothetical protein